MTHWKPTHIIIDWAQKTVDVVMLHDEGEETKAAYTKEEWNHYLASYYVKIGPEWTVLGEPVAGSVYPLSHDGQLTVKRRCDK